MLFASFLSSTLLGLVYLRARMVPVRSIVIAQATAATTYFDFAVFGLIAGYSSLLFHECGHYIWLSLIGMDNLNLSIGIWGGQVTHGTPHSRLLTPLEYQMLGFAGFGAMRLTASGANFLARRLKVNRWIIGLIGSIYLFNRMAVVFGVEQSFLGKNDLSMIADAAAVASYLSPFDFLAAYALICLADIFLTRDDIFENALRVVERRSPALNPVRTSAHR